MYYRLYYITGICECDIKNIGIYTVLLAIMNLTRKCLFKLISRIHQSFNFIQCTFVHSSFCKSSLIFNIVTSNNRTTWNILLYRYLKYPGRYLLNNNCYISRKSLEMSIIKSKLEVKSPIYWYTISYNYGISLLGTYKFKYLRSILCFHELD